ncbi:MAG: peptide-methionine (S)-S-oxide reductase MsrA [Nanoarchaeota archaeon]
MKAVFALGCFWSPQKRFSEIKGVLKTRVGYIGGHTDNPTYKNVCSDKTGHAEAIEIGFDQDVISYGRLLTAFWKMHDPTQGHRQGPDVGSQYRSAIFYNTEAQRKEAENSLKEEQKNHEKPITTEIIKAETFWPAEDYHQDYIKKKKFLNPSHLFRH